jgi:hypothetical protein
MPSRFRVRAIALVPFPSAANCRIKSSCPFFLGRPPEGDKNPSFSDRWLLVQVASEPSVKPGVLSPSTVDWLNLLFSRSLLASKASAVPKYKQVKILG